jgi:hypothetical protein
MKTKLTLLLTALAVGGAFSTAQAGPDMLAQELRRNIAESQRSARTVTAGQGGAVTFTWVASPSGKGGMLVPSTTRTTDIALFKSGKNKAKGSCDHAACCAVATEHKH